MNIGLLADVHGNVTGLKKCLRFFDRVGVAQIVFLGDIVGYLSESSKALDLLLSVNAECVLGNHDAMLLGHLEIDAQRDDVYKITETKRMFSQHQIRKISAWLPSMQKEIDGKLVLFVHGSPWDPLCEYIYPDSNLQCFATLPFDVVFMGHTHRPFVYQAESVTVVNVGSSGLPRDQGNLASCALYNTQTGECSIIRIPFDVQKIIQQYGNHLHPGVVECLLRQSQTTVVGQVIEGNLL